MVGRIAEEDMRTRIGLHGLPNHLFNTEGFQATQQRTNSYDKKVGDPEWCNSGPEARTPKRSMFRLEHHKYCPKPRVQTLADKHLVPKCFEGVDMHIASFLDHSAVIYGRLSHLDAREFEINISVILARHQPPNLHLNCNMLATCPWPCLHYVALPSALQGCCNGLTSWCTLQSNLYPSIGI